MLACTQSLGGNHKSVEACKIQYLIETESTTYRRDVPVFGTTTSLIMVRQRTACFQWSASQATHTDVPSMKMLEVTYLRNVRMCIRNYEDCVFARVWWITESHRRSCCAFVSAQTPPFHPPRPNINHNTRKAEKLLRRTADRVSKVVCFLKIRCLRPIGRVVSVVKVSGSSPLSSQTAIMSNPRWV